MKIAVIGAGLFGCTAAIKLAEYGHDVTLYESKYDIMQAASKCNQYRLHAGYHYPRSKETAMQCIAGIGSFKKEYGECLLPDWVDHYYAIETNSKIDYLQFESFMDELDLPYKDVSFDQDHWRHWLSGDHVQAIYKVTEDTINFGKLKRIVDDRITHLGINLKLNTTFLPEQLNQYEKVVSATYSNSNHLIPDDKRVVYQFELCEKPIISVPNCYQNKSIVIIDGPFCCIDPYPQMNCHVAGHVDHAIHDVYTGYFPSDMNTVKYVDSSILYHGLLSHIGKFTANLERYFPAMTNNIIHHGSMFTIRTVLPHRDHDDARPSYITKHDDRLYSIFSGKLGTAVDIANELVDMINEN